MAIPKVFVSSTCYDLKYIREDIKFFIRNIGYEPVLSDDGDVYYNPDIHTHESCISEVATCQIFVLIIGGRYGGAFKDTDQSITNMEYEEAKKLHIPIFALVEQSVYSDHHVYTENNKKNSDIDAKKIKYPSIDNIKIFDFIDEVRRAPINNAIYPFKNFTDIQNYLKKQWAGMLYYYISSGSETKRVSELLLKIQEATNKIEFLSRQTANSIGTQDVKLTIEIYDMMYHYDVVRDLDKWGISISPRLIIENETLESLCNDQIVYIDDEDEYDDLDNTTTKSFVYGGPPYKCNKAYYSDMSCEYDKLRSSILAKLSLAKISVDAFIESQPK